MKYIDEYREKALVKALSEEIHKVSTKGISLMEVCGGHTLAIHRFGIPALLPETIRLLSGPGCPVCVTSHTFIDKAVMLARMDDVIITTYGDLIRVPGSFSSLDREKAAGRDIRVVFSTLEALEIVRQNPEKTIVFLGIGFETTSPASAAAIDKAYHEGISNFKLLSSHKIMAPAMEALTAGQVELDGYICPGHVSTITGSSIYEPIAEKRKLGCVISGFEPVDILESVLILVKQHEKNEPKVEIQYRRAVKPEGNIIAKTLLAKIFEPAPDYWRGLGVLPGSGLKLRQEYENFDASLLLDGIEFTDKEPEGCICGEILMGLKIPPECKLFKTACSPLDPVGACMVSSEGACHTYYRYYKK